jgi:hypothetical protein
VSEILAGHIARARELLAGPAAPGLFDLASRVGALEELLATICDDVEGAANPNHGSDLAPGSRVIPPCPECTARARRDVRWTGGLPSGGDSWRCGACGSTWATEEEK